jgi:plastocyanin
MDDGIVDHQDSEGETQSTQTEGETQSTQTEGETQSTQTEGTSFLASILSPLQLLPSQTDVDSEQNSQELSNVNSLSEPSNCDPEGPACEPEPSNCDPEGPACEPEPSNCVPEDPFCGEIPTDEAGRCDDGVDNDQDGKFDGDDEDCGGSGGPTPKTEVGLCNDGIDNDGDGRTDTDDDDCGTGGPPGITSPGNALSRGGNNEGGSGNALSRGGNNEGGSGNALSRGGNNEDGVSITPLNGEAGDSFLPDAIAKLVQEAEGQIEGKIYYILIENVNNDTNFDPDKVTLTDGFTVVWINEDNSKDNSLTITDDSGKPLLNSNVQSNNFVKYKFESEGTYFYSDPDNPQSGGIITVLKSGVGSEDEISKPI